MIPFRDKNPSGTFPFITIALITLNGGAFIFEVILGNKLEDFLFQYGVVPVKIVYFLSHPSLSPVNIKEAFLPFLTGMFLHGGVVHILGNMWYLWIFGDNVEDRLGHFKFLGFYVLCGILASIVHVAFNLHVGVPCVGASGAIAGVLGAYMITFPRARVLCILPLWFIWQVVELPAMVVLGFWFFIQFFNGAAAITATQATAGGVAWWAHIGGFAFGVFFMWILPKKRMVIRTWED
jgi:membrane associated rhomboid family serine protease